MIFYTKRVSRIFRFPIALLLLLITTFCFGQKAIPELWGQRVHDESHVLKPETIDALEKKLKAYEDSTSNQIAILIIQSLDGDAVEEYSLRVAEKWKLGQKEKDNGALLLVAVDDHKMRIEVGHGLEGVLTDAKSSRIIRNEMAPNFRRGDYDTGIEAGINAITKAIAGEYKADEEKDDSLVFIVLGVGIAVISILALIIAFVKEFKSVPSGKKESSAKTKYSKSSVGKKKNGSPLPGVGISTSSSESSSVFSGSSLGGDFLGGGGSFGGGGASGSW